MSIILSLKQVSLKKKLAILLVTSTVTQELLLEMTTASQYAADVFYAFLPFLQIELFKRTYLRV